MSISEQNPSERMMRANWTFTHASRSGGIQEVLRAAQTFFHGPLILLDELLRVSYYTEDDLPENPLWQQILSGRCLSTDFFTELLAVSGTEHGSFYEPFFADSGIFEPMPLYMGELVQNDTILGHLLIFSDDADRRDENLLILRELLYILTVSMTRHENNIDYWSRAMSTRLQDLLQPDSSNYLKELAVSTLERNIAGRFAVIVSPFGDNPTQRAFAQLAVIRLQQTYRSVISLIFENAIVTLFGGIRYSSAAPILRPDNHETVRRLFDFFNQYHMICGLSNTFSDLAGTRVFYLQALYAAQYVGSTTACQSGSFLDLMPMPLFATVAEKIPGRVFLHPVFFQVRRYDEKHGTNYEQTLRTYLLSMQNKDTAAAKLNIHKNTLTYRLNRIMELFSIPFEDETTSLNLLCSALLLSVDDSLGDR